MPIRVDCPHCNAQLQAPDELAGKAGQCPQCKQPVKVPNRGEKTDES